MFEVRQFFFKLPVSPDSTRLANGQLKGAEVVVVVVVRNVLSKVVEARAVVVVVATVGSRVEVEGAAASLK